MKLIDSHNRSLERRVKLLEAEKLGLEAEVERWRTAYQLVWKRGGRDHVRRSSVVGGEVAGTLRSAGSVAAATADMPSYQRPTVAFRKRSLARIVEEPEPEPEPAEGDEHGGKRLAGEIGKVSGGIVYEKGELVAYTGRVEKLPGYMRHTQASAHHAGVESYSATKHRRSTDCLPDWEVSPADYESTAPWGTPGIHEEDIDPTLSCRKCEDIESAYFTTTDTSLASRSGLNDSTFATSPAAYCNVPVRLQFRLLRRALGLAQETIWCALRAHWPGTQRFSFLEGPQEFRFGRTELEDRGWVSEAAVKYQICDQPGPNVKGCLMQCVELRNVVCHPSHQKTRRIEGLLRDAQQLAVYLRDEKRAFKVRGLRDDLRVAAEEAYAEIETLGPLANLPFARPWALHHQRLFDEVWGSRQLQWFGDRYPAIIARAAASWRFKYCQPGELDPVYLQNVERVKSFMRVSEHGRRASVAGPLDQEDSVWDVAGAEVACPEPAAQEPWPTTPEATTDVW